MAAMEDFDFQDWYVGGGPGQTSDLEGLDFGDGASNSKRSKDGKDGNPKDKRQLNKQAADRYRRRKRAQFEELQTVSSQLEA